MLFDGCIEKEIIPDQPIITLQSAPLPQSIIVPDRIETLHVFTILFYESIGNHKINVQEYESVLTDPSSWLYG